MNRDERKDTLDVDVKDASGKVIRKGRDEKMREIGAYLSDAKMMLYKERKSTLVKFSKGKS